MASAPARSKYPSLIIICRSFLNVVQLVQARMSLIPGSTIVRLWHHTVLNLFKFLAFHRL